MPGCEQQYIAVIAMRVSTLYFALTIAHPGVNATLPFWFFLISFWQNNGVDQSVNQSIKVICNARSVVHRARI